MIRRFACIAVVLALLTACGGGGMVRRISEPAASIQQLTVRADGRWDVQLRINNFSSVAMRFDRVDLGVNVGGADAGRLNAQPALTIAPESADVIDIALVPSAAARLQVADALAGGRGVAYTLKGTVSATPDAGKIRNFDITRDSALSPAPGLPGVLR